MKLELWYAPVDDLPAALAFYRDTLGWTEVWREGDTTASLQPPGSEVQVMLDAGGEFTAGPIFTVDSVQGFRAAAGAGLDWRFEPFEIPGGAMGGFADPAGNVVYVLDQAGAGSA